MQTDTAPSRAPVDPCPTAVEQKPRLTLLHGDESDLYRRYHRGVVAAVRGRFGPDLAEDASQFAWSQMLRYQPDRDRMYPWLVLTARREAIRLARLRRQETAADGEINPLTGLAENVGERIAHPVPLEQRIDGLNALRSLAALPERQQRALARKVAGLTYREIEAELGWSYSQVNRHLTRARRTLREAA